MNKIKIISTMCGQESMRTVVDGSSETRMAPQDTFGDMKIYFKSLQV